MIRQVKKLSPKGHQLFLSECVEILWLIVNLCVEPNTLLKWCLLQKEIVLKTLNVVMYVFMRFFLLNLVVDKVLFKRFFQRIDKRFCNDFLYDFSRFVETIFVATIFETILKDMFRGNVFNDKFIKQNIYVLIVSSRIMF